MSKIELWFWKHQHATQTIIVHNNSDLLVPKITLVLENNYQYKHTIMIENISPSEARPINLPFDCGLHADFFPISRIELHTDVGFTYIFRTQGDSIVLAFDD